jgi:16S rRNA (adenine1518-N6/adenine1519-N6)-dimethyltransferase
MRFTKLRGQHILADRRVAEKIVSAAELSSADTVLEVGPGLGVLTRLILPRVHHYIGVELDPRFVQALQNEFALPLEARPRLSEVSPQNSAEVAPQPEFVEGDILKIKISDLFSNYTLTPKPYTLISNLPYNITSAFFKKILTEKNPPERIVIMIQKEVADRICLPTTKNQRPTTLFGLMCNLYAECEYLFRVPGSAFNPPPKVESAVIRLRPRSDASFFEKWGIERAAAEEVIGFIAMFFKNPRKMMSNALGRDRAQAIKNALIALGERPDSRPADLSLGKWLGLWKILK